MPLSVQMHFWYPDSSLKLIPLASGMSRNRNFLAGIFQGLLEEYSPWTRLME